MEKDPNGLKPSDPGAKLDDGKLLAGLVIKDFSQALELVIEVGTYGANKYSKSGWINVPDGIERYMDALYRHLLKYNQGERVDKESGLSHLAHAAWNLLAVLELKNKKK